MTSIFIKLSDWAMFAFMIFMLFFVIYFGYSIYSIYQKKFIKSKKFTLSSLAIICLILYFSKCFFENKIFENTILALRDSSTKIFVDDVSVSIAEQLAIAFEGRTNFKKNGSSPVKSISIKIVGDGFSINYLLRQDSRDKNFYWVYIPESKMRRDFSFINISL